MHDMEETSIQCDIKMAVSVNDSQISNNLTHDVISDYAPSVLSRDANIMGATLGSLVITFGIFGNVLVILAVLFSKPLMKASNMFIVSLAVCDLFQTIMVRPLFLHTYTQGRWVFDSRVCLYALYASNLAILESILHVSAIAFYRYIILVHSNAARKFQNPKTVAFLIALIYIIPLMIIVLPSLPKLRAPTTMGREVSFNSHIMFCAYNKYSNKADDFSGSTVGIIKKGVFLISTSIVLFYCYIRIYHKVRCSGRSINRIEAGIHPARVRREMILLKTVVVIFLAFVLSYLPVTILYATDKTTTLHDFIYVTSVIMLWCSSSINWMIYGLMNRQFLAAYRYVLCGLRFNITTTDNNSGSHQSMRAHGSSQALRILNASPETPIVTERKYHMAFIDT